MELDPRTRQAIAAYDRSAREYQEAFRLKRPLADIRRFADLAKPDSLVLDVGCGPGSDLRLLGDTHIHPVGVDLSLGALRFARMLLPRHALVRCSFLDLPFPADTFGGLWMSSAFTHMPRGQWRDAFAGLLHHLESGPVYFSCYRGSADMEEVEDPILGTVHRSQATEDEVEALLASHGLRDVWAEVRPDPIVDRRRPWVVAMGVK